MNQRLVPSSRKHTPDFDPLTDYAEDVERLLAVATNAGYKLTPRDAAELWRQHAGDVCASWFVVDGDDSDILAALLKHADVQADVADTLAPPDGYASWLDYAVDTMDTRAEEIDRLFTDKPISRQSMRDAVRAELAALRRKAGE